MTKHYHGEGTHFDGVAVRLSCFHIQLLFCRDGGLM